jgi:hypothetical protein
MHCLLQCTTIVRCCLHASVGLKRDIVRAQAENETLAAIRDRLDNEGKFAEEQLLKIKVYYIYISLSTIQHSSTHVVQLCKCVDSVHVLLVILQRYIMVL